MSFCEFHPPENWMSLVLLTLLMYNIVQKNTFYLFCLFNQWFRYTSRCWNWNSLTYFAYPFFPNFVMIFDLPIAIVVLLLYSLFALWFHKFLLILFHRSAYAQDPTNSIGFRQELILLALYLTALVNPVSSSVLFYDSSDFSWKIL